MDWCWTCRRMALTAVMDYTGKVCKGTRSERLRRHLLFVDVFPWDLILLYEFAKRGFNYWGSFLIDISSTTIGLGHVYENVYPHKINIYCNHLHMPWKLRQFSSAAVEIRVWMSIASTIHLWLSSFVLAFIPVDLFSKWESLKFHLL